MTDSITVSDSLRHGLTEDEGLRIVTVVCTDALAEACTRAGLHGIDAVAMGRALIGGFLLIASAKRDEERLRLQIAGEGQIGQIIVDVHGDGRGRAAVQAALPADHALHILLDETPRPVAAPVVGLPGTITLTRDLALARRYQGHVDLVSAEIDEDLQAYLDESEQVRSALRCAVRIEHGSVAAAVGVLVQALPGTDDEAIEAVRERLGAGALFDATGPIVTHDQLAALALGHDLKTDGPLVLGPQSDMPLRFECNCGPERAQRVLSSLGADDLDALADEQPITEIRCNFCGDVTEVSAATVREIATAIRKGSN